MSPISAFHGWLSANECCWLLTTSYISSPIHPFFVYGKLFPAVFHNQFWNVKWGVLDFMGESCTHSSTSLLREFHTLRCSLFNSYIGSKQWKANLLIIYPWSLIIHKPIDALGICISQPSFWRRRYKKKTSL